MKSIRDELAHVESYKTAPLGTRQKINEAYELRLRWCQDKPRVYICSPLGAEDAAGIRQNMLAARKYCDVAEEMQPVVAKAPHAWLPEFLDDHNTTERKIGLDVGTAMLLSADAVFVCGDRISAGMKEEILLAFDKNITIHSFHPDVSKEIDVLIGENSKHIKSRPGITQQLHVLGKDPEKINALRLDLREIKTSRPAPSPILQKSFEKRFAEELSLLDSLKPYYNAREGGLSVVLHNKEDRMSKIENHIVNEAREAGMSDQAIQDHIGAYLSKTTRTPERTENQNQAPRTRH